MCTIFVSYRRDNAAADALHLASDLKREFGDDSVFIDVGSGAIRPSQDFPKVIEEHVAHCRVFLAVIGPGWAEVTDETRRRRLDDPEDWVRIETSRALRREIPVIPVLVRGAAMPLRKSLPEDIKTLADKNAVELRLRGREHDRDRLIEALHELLDPQRVLPWKVSAAIALLVLVATVGYFSFRYLWVSVPDVRGRTPQEATRALQDVHLAVSTQVHKDQSKPPNTVLTENPEPGTRAWRGATIALAVTPLPLVTVPNVIGKPRDSAEKTLRDAGLSFQENVVATKTGQTPGTVSQQDPTAGTEINRDAVVTLTVTEGSAPAPPAPESVEVPSLVGILLADAQSALLKSHLSLGNVVPEERGDMSPGTVIQQQPLPRAKVQVDTLVDLTIAKAPAVSYVTVPDLVGSSMENAKSKLHDLSLVPVVTGKITKAKAPDTVIDQSPKAGSQVQRGSMVDLTISQAPKVQPVPSVVDRKLAEAQEVLKKRGFEVEVEKQVPRTDLTPQTVVSQSPDGDTAETGSTVKLTTSFLPSNSNPVLGTWRNSNEGTSSIRVLEITQKDGAWYVKAECNSHSPRDYLDSPECVEKSSSGKLDGDNLSALWQKCPECQIITSMAISRKGDHLTVTYNHPDDDPRRTSPPDVRTLEFDRQHY